MFHKDRKKLRVFLTQVNIYIQFNTQKLRIIEVRIIFVVTYLRDRVFDWFKSYLIDYLEKLIKDKKEEIKKIFASYSYFKKCIRQIYREVNKEWTAK